MAAIPKFGSFKPKAKAASGTETEAKIGPQHARDLERPDIESREHSNTSVQRLRRSEYDSHRRRHHSDDHHHRSKLRQNHGEREQRKDVITVDEPVSNESDVFLVDRRGDAKNVEYGSLHRYSIPPYHRTGYGRLLGAPAHIKINREESTEQAIVLSHANQSGHWGGNRPLSGKVRAGNEKTLRIVHSAPVSDQLDVQPDFIALRQNLKRKRGSESPDRGAPSEVDYRSIEGKAKAPYRPDDDDLELASDSGVDEVNDSVETRTRQESAVLTRQAKERPTELEPWLALIDHQAMNIRSGGYAGSLTSLEKRTLADVRLSIYDQAFKHISVDKPGYESLVLGMLREGSLIWERSKLMTKWEDALKKSPGSIQLWTAYLDFVQTNHSSFRYEHCKTVYVQCLKILQGARSSASLIGNQDVSLAQCYVFLRFTALVRDAGYDELAYGLWQLLLEYSFFQPPGFGDHKPALPALEDFWDSDVPRVGEDGAQGWSHYAQHGNTNTRMTVYEGPGTLDRAQAFLSFAIQEVSFAQNLHLPATADDESALNDPFRTVMFSDMREIIETLLNELPKEALIGAFLIFMGLPPLPDNANGYGCWDWQADQYLRTETAAVLSHADGGIVKNERQTTFSLFDRAFQAFQSRIDAVGQYGKATVDFVDRVLERLVSAQPQEDGLAEYYIAYRLSLLPSEAPKTAKRLLKARPSSLRLYNAYALTETRLPSRIGKADEVWATALKMSSDFGEQAKDDVIFLWHAWVHAKMQHRKHHDALHLLGCMSDGSLDPKAHQRQDFTVTASQRLKSVQCFRDGWEDSTYKHKYGYAVLFAECHIAFSYLVNGLTLEPAFATNEKYQARLAGVNTAAEELLHQAQATISKLHIDHHRPYKPATVREKVADSIRRFPNNSLFLELYAQLQANFQLEDRVRASLRSELLGSTQATIVSWSSAIAEELRRCTAEVSGSTEISVRSTFARALLQSDSPVKHSLTLWAMWFRFELPSRYGRMQPPRELTETQRGQALQRAKQVFLDGLRHLPWSKVWVVMGLQVFARDGGMSWRELRQVYDVLAERELRVRVGLEEMEDAIASMDVAL